MLKIGVLGAGNLGKTHIRLLKEIGAYDLQGIYDPSKERLNYLARESGAMPFDSLDQLLNECDIIDITETSTPFEIAKKAIKLSKHVFIEKPLTLNASESKTLIRLAAEANVKVQVGHVERFNPAFLRAKELIGNPLFIESQRSVEINTFSNDFSIVMDLMIHDIDIVLSLIKANVRKISAGGVAVINDTPDIINARIEFDNGAVANLTASIVALESIHRSRFFRRDAYVSVDFLENKANIVRPETTQNQNLSVVSSLEQNTSNVFNNRFLEHIEVLPLDVIKIQLESFSEAITNNTRPLVPIDDGYKSLEVANKIIEQLRLNSIFAAANTIIA